MDGETLWVAPHALDRERLWIARSVAGRHRRFGSREARKRTRKARKGLAAGERSPQRASGAGSRRRLGRGAPAVGGSVSGEGWHGSRHALDREMRCGSRPTLWIARGVAGRDRRFGSREARKRTRKARKGLAAGERSPQRALGLGSRRRLGRRAAAVGGAASSHGRNVFGEVSHEVLGACVDVQRVLGPHRMEVDYQRLHGGRLSTRLRDRPEEAGPAVPARG